MEGKKTGREDEREGGKEEGMYLSHTLIQCCHHSSKYPSVLILNVGKFLHYIRGCLKWLNVISTMDGLVRKI